MAKKKQNVKIIGIPGYAGVNSKNFGVSNTYLEFANRFGNPRIIMPWEEHVQVDLLILPGGLDTAPTNYGEVPSFYTSNQDVFKEFFYHNRLDNYINAKTPILGICLGFQQLAAKFGSTLCQNLMNHNESSDRGVTAHKVYKSLQYRELPLKEKGGVVRNSVYSIKGELSFDVNSHHHQGVTNLDLGTDLQGLLFAKLEGLDYYHETSKHEDNNVFLVEAFKHKSLPIAGVQYHPEEINDFYSADLVQELLNFKRV